MQKQNIARLGSDYLRFCKLTFILATALIREMISFFFIHCNDLLNKEAIKQLLRTTGTQDLIYFFAFSQKTKEVKSSFLQNVGCFLVLPRTLNSLKYDTSKLNLGY